jgi:hypothetical protein
LGGAGRKKIGLIGRLHMSVRKGREGVTAGMHKPEEKACFGEYAKVSQASWAERGR